jgi:protein-S-isoprenylcysteine O-methyltransferase Ste14
MRALEVRIPPPAVLLAFGAVMWWAARALPLLRIAAPARLAVAITIGALGILLSASGAIIFRRRGTTTNPMKPGKASSLVTGGIYRWTRNPMYLGLAIILLAWAIFLANLACLVALPAFTFYIYRFQIAPEERALEEKFGAEFSTYCRKVGRWI